MPTRIRKDQRVLTNEQLSTFPESKGRQAPDLEISAILIAERLVGVILGWDLVDWSAVEPHKGKRFFFGRTSMVEASIHDQLAPLFDRCDPGKNDFSALKPSPIVNANLSSLVGYLCRHVGRHSLQVNEAMGSALQRTEQHDKLHLAVTRRLIRRIETDPCLGERAGRLKQIAAAAECELEKHFADLINQRLESRFLPNGSLDPYKIKGVRGLARSRVKAASALNQRELVGLSVPNLVLDDEAQMRIEMAKILVGHFPYVRNYELMLLAEIAMLQTPLTPRFARERKLADKEGDIDAALIGRLDHALANIAGHLGPSWRHQSRPSLEDQTIAICGSGPLPMTALFLHLFTGAKIVLVDDDPAAIERSMRLIGNLERLEILGRGVLTTLHQDAGRLQFHAADMSGTSSPDRSLACDAVMIASLVDHQAKASIAAQIGNDRSAPAELIMRSASGLSAKLAYDPVPTEIFSSNNLAYCGETQPATQVATHLDREEAASQGVACAASPDVLAIAHPDVVNTTEVYRRIAKVPAAIDHDFSACKGTNDWVRELERVAAKLRSSFPASPDSD
jgi:hypothetical protein